MDDEEFELPENAITIDPVEIRGSVSRANAKDWLPLDESGNEIQDTDTAYLLDTANELIERPTDALDIAITRAPEVARRTGRSIARAATDAGISPLVSAPVVGQTEAIADYLDSGTAGTTGLVQGSTLGWSDELGGLINSFINDTDYETERDRLREIQNADRERNPAMYGIGSVAGGLATLPLSLETLAPSMAARLGTVGTGLLEGAALGGIGGAGSSEEEDLSGILEDAGEGAAFGGLLGGAIGTARGMAGELAGLGRNADELRLGTFSEGIPEAEEIMTSLPRQNLLHYIRNNPELNSAADSLYEVAGAAGRDSAARTAGSNSIYRRVGDELIDRRYLQSDLNEIIQVGSEGGHLSESDVSTIRNLIETISNGGDDPISFNELGDIIENLRGENRFASELIEDLMDTYGSEILGVNDLIEGDIARRLSESGTSPDELQEVLNLLQISSPAENDIPQNLLLDELGRIRANERTARTLADASGTALDQIVINPNGLPRLIPRTTTARIGEEMAARPGLMELLDLFSNDMPILRAPTDLDDE